MATLQKLRNDLPTCSICSDVFKDSCTLGCEHNFCQGCLTDFIKTQQDAIKTGLIPCPLCHQPSRVLNIEKPVEEWAAEFRGNHDIQSLNDSSGEDVNDTELCTLCKEDGKSSKAAVWCTQCEIFLCDICHNVHRRIASTRHHVVSDITGAIPRLRKRFLCEQHSEELVKLYCRDHKKALCTVCCSIEHRTCREVITIQEVIPEMTKQISSHKEKLQSVIKSTTRTRTTKEALLKKISDKSETVKSEIRDAMKQMDEMLKEKEKRLLREVEEKARKQLGYVKLEIQQTDTIIQKHQQDSDAIDEAVTSESSSDIYKLFELLQSNTSNSDNVEEMAAVSEMSLTFNMDRMREAVNTMKILEDLEMIEVSMRNDAKQPDINDIGVLQVNGAPVLVIADGNNNSLKSITLYSSKKLRFSRLTLDNVPWSWTRIGGKKIAVSVPGSNQIIKVGVNPKLKLISSIKTVKNYYGLTYLANSSTFVAGSISPPSVDMLNDAGEVQRSFTHLPEIKRRITEPYFLQLTREGNILVCDWGLRSVICMTQTGGVIFSYSPVTNDVNRPFSVVSTKEGQLLLTEWNKNTVSKLTRDGKLLRTVITAENGVVKPYCLCFDHEKLYVAMGYRIRILPSIMESNDLELEA